MNLKQINLSKIDSLINVAKTLSTSYEDDVGIATIIDNKAEVIAELLTAVNPQANDVTENGYIVDPSLADSTVNLFESVASELSGKTLPVFTQDGLKYITGINVISGQNGHSIVANINNDLQTLAEINENEGIHYIKTDEDSDINIINLIGGLREVVLNNEDNQSIADLINEVATTDVNPSALQSRLASLSNAESDSNFGLLLKQFLSDSRTFSPATIIDAMIDTVSKIYNKISDDISNEELAFDSTDYNPAREFSHIVPSIISSLTPLLTLAGVMIGGVLGWIGVAAGTILKVVFDAVAPTEKTYGTIHANKCDAYVYAQPCFQYKTSASIQPNFYIRYKAWLQSVGYQPGTVYKIYAGAFAVYCWVLKDDTNWTNIYLEGKMVLNWSPTMKKISSLVTTGSDLSLDDTGLGLASGLKMKLFGSKTLYYDGSHDVYEVLPMTAYEDSSGNVTYNGYDYGSYYYPVGYSNHWTSQNSNLNRFKLDETDYSVLSALTNGEAVTDKIARIIVYEQICLLLGLFAKNHQYEFYSGWHYGIRYSDTSDTWSIYRSQNYSSPAVRSAIDPIFYLIYLEESGILRNQFSSVNDLLDRYSDNMMVYADWENIQTFVTTVFYNTSVVVSAAEYMDWADGTYDCPDNYSQNPVGYTLWMLYNNNDGKSPGFLFGYVPSVTNKGNALVYPGKWSTVLLMYYWLIIGGIVIVGTAALIGWSIFKAKMKKKAWQNQAQADMAAFNDKNYDLTTKQGLKDFTKRYKRFAIKASIYNWLSGSNFDDQYDQEEIKNLIKDNKDLLDDNYTICDKIYKVLK